MDPYFFTNLSLRDIVTLTVQISLFIKTPVKVTFHRSTFEQYTVGKLNQFCSNCFWINIIFSQGVRQSSKANWHYPALLCALIMLSISVTEFANTTTLRNQSATN